MSMLAMHSCCYTPTAQSHHSHGDFIRFIPTTHNDRKSFKVTYLEKSPFASCKMRDTNKLSHQK